MCTEYLHVKVFFTATVVYRMKRAEIDIEVIRIQTEFIEISSTQFIFF